MTNHENIKSIFLYYRPLKASFREVKIWQDYRKEQNENSSSRYCRMHSPWGGEPEPLMRLKGRRHPAHHPALIPRRPRPTPLLDVSDNGTYTMEYSDENGEPRNWRRWNCL